MFDAFGVELTAKQNPQGNNMYRYFTGAACAAALAAFACGAAIADPTSAPAPAAYAVVPQAVVGADYSYLSLNHGGSANSFGGEAGGIMPFGGGFSGQIVGAYHSLDLSHGGGTLNNYNVGGDVAWSNDTGRIGVNVAYTGDNIRGANLDVTNYGVFGEYYAGDQFSLGLRGGGATVSASSGGFGGVFGRGSTNGGYVGGEVVAYATPDFDVQGHVNYIGVSRGDQTTVGAQAEYLLSQSLPLSGWVGYDYATLSGSGFRENSNTFSIGLRYYFGGNGSLVQRQRSGVDGWGPAAMNVQF
jgi:hypothetical protein